MPKGDSESAETTSRVYGAGHKLIGKNYETDDLYAKVTGLAKYAEDLSRRRNVVLQAAAQPAPSRAREAPRRTTALAMPGVKAILTGR